MKRRNEAAAAAVEFGEDPWVLAARRNASKELSTVSRVFCLCSGPDVVETRL